MRQELALVASLALALPGLAGAQAKELSADAGYLSEQNLRELKRRRISGYIATGRQKHGDRAATRLGKRGTLTYAMLQKLRRAGHRSRYRLRKQIVEPTYGQVKEARGFGASRCAGCSACRTNGR